MIYVTFFEITDYSISLMLSRVEPSSNIDNYSIDTIQELLKELQNIKMTKIQHYYFREMKNTFLHYISDHFDNNKNEIVITNIKVYITIPDNILRETVTNEINNEPKYKHITILKE